MKRLLFALCIVFTLCTVNVYCTESEEPYQKEDGRWYKMVDGVEYQIVNGNEGGSFTDVIRNYSDTNKLGKEDSETVARAGGYISSKTGFVTSFLIYILFGFCFVTSATDLLWIGAPPLRPLLWDNASQSQGNQWGTPSQVNGQVQGMNQGQSGTIKKIRCFVSDELKFVANKCSGYPVKTMILEYLKKRAAAVVFMMVVVYLLIVSSVFTDFGLNIGEFILSFVK